MRGQITFYDSMMNLKKIIIFTKGCGTKNSNLNNKDQFEK